ncbi:hypothetical protein CYMTET_16054, partial [Cymbomonas tetramitiformis]
MHTCEAPPLPSRWIYAQYGDHCTAKNSTSKETQEIKALNKEVLIAQRKLDQVISGKNSVFAKDVMLKRRPQASEIKALNKEVLIAQRKLEQVISDKNAGDQSTEQG